MDSDDIVLLRRRLRTANREGKPILVCAECATKLELRSNKLSRKRREKDYYFFKHYKDVNECSIKTNSRLPIGVLLARKYENVKESIPHINLKNHLGYIIEHFHSPEKISIDNKFYFDKSGNGEKRKPDVYALINGREYAFEIQLNTTFLSVIEEREAFYERNDVSIIWIFKYFPLEEEIQRLTQKDIYVPNRLNAFVLDDDMLDLSIKQKKLHLKVFYKTFSVDRGKICSQWKNKVTTIENLNYGDNYKPFFYDSFADKEKAKQELERIQEEDRIKQVRIQKIRRQEQERLAEQKRIKQQKILRCRTLIKAIQSELDLLNEKQLELIKDKENLKYKIETLQAQSQEISERLSDTVSITGKMYNYLKKYSGQPWTYMSNPLDKYCDISSIKNKFCERIKAIDNTKREIKIKLEKEILPRKTLIVEFSVRNIGGIEYSIIPPKKKYEGLVEKFPKEIKVIDTKDLGTIFESNCLKYA